MACPDHFNSSTCMACWTPSMIHFHPRAAHSCRAAGYTIILVPVLGNQPPTCCCAIHNVDANTEIVPHGAVRGVTNAAPMVMLRKGPLTEKPHTTELALSYLDPVVLWNSVDDFGCAISQVLERSSCFMSYLALFCTAVVLLPLFTWVGRQTRE